MNNKRTSPIWKTQKKQFENLIKSCNNITEVLSFYGLKNKGRNNHTLIKRIKEDGLDIELNRLREGGKKNKIRKAVPIEFYLVKNSNCKSNFLKKRLLKEGFLEEKCNECGLEKIWNGKDITLQLDHINGDSADNRLSNIRILCPNCHSQTKTFSGKNVKRIYNYCPECGKKIQKNSKNCVLCARKKFRKVERPEHGKLVEEVRKNGYCYVGRKYGVSDNAIRKWIKYNNKDLK